MLTPTKHSHPDQTVIFVALRLLSKLRKRRLLSFDECRDWASTSAQGGDVLFLPAMNFLYLLGVVEYRRKTDAFEYVGR
jgi:hypothetical protein